MSVQQGKNLQLREGEVLGTEDVVNVALLLWSLPAGFSIHQAHFSAQCLPLLLRDHRKKICLFDYCKGELQSTLTMTSI